MMLVLLVLVILLIAGLPTWGYSRSFGVWPSSIMGVLVVFFLLWLFFGSGSVRFR